MATRDGSIELDWPDKTRTFRLRIGQLRDLQEACGNRGPLTIWQALMNGTWLVDDIVATIRLGLIGGGLSKEEAIQLVNKHCADGQLRDCVIIAQAIILRAVTGPMDEPLEAPPGKGGSGKDQATRTGSSSPRSTATAPRSGSRRGRSTN